VRAQRTRRLTAPAAAVWKVIEDPFAMPRWWPGVERVEGVEGDRFTQVLRTKRGRTVRMDFRVLVSEAPRGARAPAGAAAGHRTWEQEVAGTPFERVLHEAVTEVLIEPADGGASQVTIAQVQRLRGYSRTGTLLLRRATDRRLGEALDGLGRII
jgi:carbon monoxide dehydrogenase subunit G